MVADQEWFSGRAVDEHDPIVIYRPLFWAGLLISGLLILYACGKAVPECDTIPAQVMETARGPALVLDTDGVKALIAREKAIQSGQCRMSFDESSN